MANNYVESSFVVDNLTDSEIEWWKKEELRNQEILDKDLDDEECDPIPSLNWVLEEKERQIWFSHDESIDVESAALVIQRFLYEVRPKGKVGFTWAETCSKPRLNEFGGGACFITANEMQWNNAWGWLCDKIG